MMQPRTNAIRRFLPKPSSCNQMKAAWLALLLLISPMLAAHESESHYDRIQLSASAQQQLANDTIIVNLYAEEEGSDPAKLADSVNRRIRQALDFLKPHADIKLQTRAYSTHPVYQKNRIVRWRVRQSLRLQSRNITVVSKLLGHLQQDLALQGMQFTVSNERKTRTDDELIARALDAFESRARTVVRQLRRKAYKIVKLNITTSGGARPYAAMARNVMMDSAVAAPAVEAGEQTVQVNVSGEIELE